jgi:uncharacterized alpha-E superfamily protein
VLCRVADDVFWLSRYVERGVAVSRLIEVTQHLELDTRATDFWAPLVGDAIARQVTDVRRYLTSAEDNPSSLISCVRQTRELARGVRECISSEMWEEINTLWMTLQHPRSSGRPYQDARTFHRIVREHLQQFQGLADLTLAHDEPWQFLRLGTLLERADAVTRLLNRQVHLLARGRGEEDTVRWLALLRSCGSAEAYASRYSMRVEPPRIVEFLLLDPLFPQSVRFSLDGAETAMRAIAALRAAAGNDPGAPARTLGKVRGYVEHIRIDEIFDVGLDVFLKAVQEGIEVTTEHLTTTYFRDLPRAPGLSGVARAAMIMAEQQ